MIALTRGERTCREIAALYRKRFGGELGEGTLYTTLTRLAARGLIEEGPPPAPNDDQRLRWYRITAAGEEVLRGASEHVRKMVRVLAAG